MSKFLPTSGFKSIDPKEFDCNKYVSNNSKRCILEVGLEYPKGLRELHYDYPLAPNKIHYHYPLAPNKIETKQEMLSSIN